MAAKCKQDMWAKCCVCINGAVQQRKCVGTNTVKCSEESAVLDMRSLYYHQSQAVAAGQRWSSGTRLLWAASGIQGAMERASECLTNGSHCELSIYHFIADNELRADPQMQP